MKSINLPDSINTESELLEVLSRPSPELVKYIVGIRSSLVVLGAGGKMGPTLCVMAKRAANEAGHDLRVIAVSRFSNPVTRCYLNEHGVETLSCDLLDHASIQSLPDAENIIYMLGLKFGTAENPALTWASSLLPPVYLAGHYAGSKMVVLSTGNVYPLVPVAEGGATEAIAPEPVGEYANAALARERLFEYYSEKHGTPTVLLRLNYALELRYGILLDIGQRIWNGQPVDLANGYFNCIWQADANDLVLRSLELVEIPARPWNLTAPGVVEVRFVAEKLGFHLQKPVTFKGKEAKTALLNDASQICSRLGSPKTPIDTMMKWTAEWIRNGGRTLNKPTHFEVRDGQF